MSDATFLPEDRWSGSWYPDAQLLRVVGWRFGPAGAAVVDLAGGVRLALDAARPQQLTELVVDAPNGRPSPAAMRAVAHLIGAEPAARLLALVEGKSPDRLTPITEAPLDDRLGSPRRERDAAPSSVGVLTSFALAADLAMDASIHDVTAAFAGAEAAHYSTRLAELELVDPGAPRVLAERFMTSLAAFELDQAVAIVGRSERSVELLRSVLDLLDPDDPSRGPVGMLVHRAISRTMARQGMRQLAEEGVPEAIAFFDRENAARDAIDGSPPVALAAAAAAPRAAAPESRLAARAKTAEAAADMIREPVEVDAPEHLMAWLSEGGTHLNVIGRASSAHAGTAWVRAFDRRRQLLLGLAPLRAEGGQSTSLILLPPGYAGGDLIVDVSVEPGEPRPTAARVAVENAIRSGRRAARLERLGRQEMTDAWHEASDAWRDAGDDQRAALAATYATRQRARAGEPSAGVAEPLITDELLDPIRESYSS